jgi:16S rRNA (guanine966-N2)-methyltransferase
VPVPHRIRIIGGRHRGRPIPVPAVTNLRPTPDRVRETLFNWLGQDLSGARILDPYAGTGALALESLSRGASLAVAVDRNPVLIRALADCARKLGELPLETHVGDALRFLRSETRTFDVVFLDPPFADDPWAELWTALVPRLAAGAFVYAEAARALAAPPAFDIVRQGRAGSVHYHLLARSQPAPPE